MRQAYRKLAPQGVLVMTAPNPFWDGVASRLGLVAGDAHCHRVDLTTLEGWAKQAGFGRVEAFPFMFVMTGLLPYLRVPLSPRFGLGLDAWFRRLPGLAPTFVNQAVAAQKV